MIKLANFKKNIAVCAKPNSLVVKLDVKRARWPISLNNFNQRKAQIKFTYGKKSSKSSEMCVNFIAVDRFLFQHHMNSSIRIDSVELVIVRHVTFSHFFYSIPLAFSNKTHCFAYHSVSSIKMHLQVDIQGNKTWPKLIV